MLPLCGEIRPYQPDMHTLHTCLDVHRHSCRAAKLHPTNTVWVRYLSNVVKTIIKTSHKSEYINRWYKLETITEWVVCCCFNHISKLQWLTISIVITWCMCKWSQVLIFAASNEMKILKPVLQQLWPVVPAPKPSLSLGWNLIANAQVLKVRYHSGIWVK